MPWWTRYSMSSTIVPCPSTCISPFHDLKMLQVLLASAQTSDIVLIKRTSCKGYRKVHEAEFGAAQKPGPPLAKLVLKAGMLQGVRRWQPLPCFWVITVVGVSRCSWGLPYTSASSVDMYSSFQILLHVPEALSSCWVQLHRKSDCWLGYLLAFLHHVVYPKLRGDIDVDMT